MGIVTHERLQEITGLTQLAAMRRALRKAGIPVRQVGDRLTTTDEAITATLIGTAKPKKGPNFEAITRKSLHKAR
jgi:N-acyl-L-homoserine lactone synthetase